MINLVVFLNMFLSYFLVFVIFAVVIVGAVIVGIKCRKSKDKKDALIKKDTTYNTQD